VCELNAVLYGAVCKKGWPEPYIHTPYLTICVVISLPKRPYIHRLGIWFWPTLCVNHAACHGATVLE